IGSKDERLKTQDAPYMLILWTRQGESEIFISLCNQRNTLNLSRIFSSNDLENYERKGENCLEISVEFPSQRAEIRFLSVEDSRVFCAQPRRYFKAMTDRNPQCGEYAIFNTVLETFEDSQGPHVVFPSCGLRVYESIKDKRFKTTRRLVINSPAADTSTAPWLASHWIPLSNIRLQIDDSYVTMSWSDLKQCEKINRGNFDYHWSYVYNSEKPNKKLFMRFSSGYEAERFEECIFFLTEAQDRIERRSTIRTPARCQELRVYDLQDEVDNGRYHVIALANRSSLMHICKLYFTYRNLDFVLERESIQFPELSVPHYVTNMQRMPDLPTGDGQTPELDAVRQIDTATTLKFSHLDGMRSSQSQLRKADNAAYQRLYVS
ncbi:MAG: hypothetical protein Q9187_009469, partial [Circinaria calcarea]